MRRLVLAGPYDLRLVECPLPTVAAGEVLVRVEAAGVCGSDLYGYRGVNDRRPAGTVMGHEVSGTVEQVGEGVEAHWAGLKVTINPVLGCDACAACRAGHPQRCPDKRLIGCTPRHPGGFADYLPAPVTALTPWPGPAPLAWGAFAEPLAVGLHAVGRVAVVGRNVLVIGTGPVGIAAALAVERAGGTATMTEGEPSRSAVLRGLGVSPRDPSAVAAIAPFDVVVDCVANDETLDLALRHLRIGGSAVVVGLAAPLATIAVERLVHGDRSLRGSAQYSRASFDEAVRWLSSGQLDISSLLGWQPLAEAPAVFRSWDDESERPVRTLLTPD